MFFRVGLLASQIIRYIILDMNGVAMARHGVILWENGATVSKKRFKNLPTLLDLIFRSKIKTIQKLYLDSLFSRFGGVVFQEYIPPTVDPS